MLSPCSMLGWLNSIPWLVSLGGESLEELKLQLLIEKLSDFDLFLSLFSSELVPYSAESGVVLRLSNKDSFFSFKSVLFAKNGGRYTV